MCVGVADRRLMARIGPDAYEDALSRKGCGPMDFTGRPLRGFVFVGPQGTATAKELGFWIALALEFNPRATASRKPAGAKAPRPTKSAKSARPRSAASRRKSRKGKP
jgi:hypothetical protein